MGNINLYKSTTGNAPWSLVKENVQSPVTITENTGGSLYYAVRDEGDGNNIEPSNYKVISKPVYVFKSTDKVSKITFDDTTDVNSLIIKVISTCGDKSNHKVQIEKNVKNTGWKKFAQVAIGSNIQAKYTTAATDGVTEGSQIKFRAYIFNTTNVNYRTNNSAEYVYTLNIDSNINVQFNTMDENYYYLQSTRTDISNIDTIDGIEFIDIQNNNIRLKDTGYLSTQISNLNTVWSFNIVINFKKIGIQKSTQKNITIPNNLFNITIDGNIITNYNMIINGSLQNKGYTFNYSTTTNQFRLAGSVINNYLIIGNVDSVCGFDDGHIITLVSANKSSAIYYVSLGDAYKMCADGQYYNITSVLFSPLYQTEVIYNKLSTITGGSTIALGASIGISNLNIPTKTYYCVGYIIY